LRSSLLPASLKAWRSSASLFSAPLSLAAWIVLEAPYWRSPAEVCNGTSSKNPATTSADPQLPTGIQQLQRQQNCRYGSDIHDEQHQEHHR
jgi:hypothetical protein